MSRHRATPQATPQPNLARRLVSGAAVMLTLAAAATLLLGAFHGARLVPVLTGSMTPYAPTGSLVLTVPITGKDVSPGDVVAFRPPAPFEVVGGHPVLHRVATTGDQNGRSFMTTKGDANPTADPWRVATTDAHFQRAVLVIPYLGRAFAGGTVSSAALALGGTLLLAGTSRLRRRPQCDGTLTHNGETVRLIRA